MEPLTNEDLLHLVDLLLKCPSIQDTDIRNDVLTFLEDKARDAIARRDTARADVVNIVRACNNYPGQLAALIEGVQCYDEGTSQFKALEAFWHGLARPETPSPQPTGTNQPHSPPTLSNVDPSRLREAMIKAYPQPKFELLCLDLDTRYDLLRGNTLELKIAYLIEDYRDTPQYEQLVQKVIADHPYLKERLGL
jgi:hypothetical protein